MKANAGSTSNTKTGRRPGRPTSFNPKLAAEICERLGDGEPLASICRDKGMPKVRTVSQWKDAHPEFAEDFCRARIEGFEVLAAHALEIADDERHDWKLSQKGPITDEIAISRARLRIDTRLKLLAKWDPKRYGDKLEMTTNTEAPKMTREEFVAKLRKSPSLMQEFEGMIAEAKGMRQ